MTLTTPDKDQDTTLCDFDIASCINLAGFSSWCKLARQSAWILRAVRNFASAVPRLGMAR